MGDSLQEKGLRRLERELEFFPVTTEFLGVVENLSNHPDIASITNLTEFSLRTGAGGISFNTYLARLKKSTDKDDLAKLLAIVSQGLDYKINDLGNQMGAEPSYIAIYGPCSIQFFQPQP